MFNLIIQSTKIEILKDFREIYDYDLNHAVVPEPIGHFESEKEKTAFLNRKTLMRDFSLYLSNIFTDYYMNLYMRDRKLPILRCPVMVIDYNELYDYALCEYIGTLLGVRYPVAIRTDGRIVYGERSNPLNAGNLLTKKTEETGANKSESAYVMKRVEWRDAVMEVPVPVNRDITRCLWICSIPEE